MMLKRDDLIVAAMVAMLSPKVVVLTFGGCINLLLIFGSVSLAFSMASSADDQTLHAEVGKTCFVWTIQR
jgi:uncharacterized membrane protein YjjP (DUF1212 family)